MLYSLLVSFIENFSFLMFLNTLLLEQDCQ